MKRTTSIVTGVALLGLATAALPEVSFAQTGQVAPAADITNTEIQAAVQKSVSQAVSDQPLRMVTINGEYNVGAAVVTRAKTAGGGGALAHSQITEVYYIISGNGTLVTGGTLEDARDNTTPQALRVIGPSKAGTKILNGKSRQVGPGDMVIIPANTPHTFSEITTDRIVYMVVRVDPHKVLQTD
jgi:mannose-6-phosphate isomerase-like protein (cupin superfamily)